MRSLQQCEGLARIEPSPEEHSWDPIEEVEEFLAGSGALIQNSGKHRAYLHVRRGRIMLRNNEWLGAGPLHYQSAVHKLRSRPGTLG